MESIFFAFFVEAFQIGSMQDTPSAGLTSTDAQSMHHMMRPQDEGNAGPDSVVPQSEVQDPSDGKRMQSQASKDDGSDARNTTQADDNENSTTVIAQPQEDELDTAVCSTFNPR